MLKGIFKNIISFCMAFLVLVATMSFNINEHYCSGNLVDTSWFIQAETCDMEEQLSPSKDCEIQTKNCCKDVFKIIKGQDNLKPNITQLEFKQQLFLAAFSYSYINLFDKNNDDFIPFDQYSPPLIVKDIQVLDDVFLI